jgi:NADPH:quinone reductase-like Zn-dependent oxidoreductase
VLGYGQGAYAEYMAADPNFLIPIPDALSYEEASVVSL